MSLKIPSIASRPEFLPEFDAWSIFSEKRIAITGANGTLGKILSQKLEQNGIGFLAYQGDITIPAEMKDWIRTIRPDFFFHLAAIVPTNDVLVNPSKAMNTNALSLLHIIDGLKEFAQDCWFFYASTSHVYLDKVKDEQHETLSEDSIINPISLYGATKLAGESICRPMAEAYGIPLCVGRIFSYYHSTQPESYLIPSLCKRIDKSSQGGHLKVHNSGAVRDFLDADMVIDAILWLASRKATGIVNIASGVGASVKELAEKIALALNKEIIFLETDDNTRSNLTADISRLSNIINVKND